jgi:4-hydroxy-2-oxoheptanedioate aldolase
MQEVNKVKRTLIEGKSVVGAFVMFPSPDIVEMLGYSNFDFVIIDSEHGRMTIEQIECLVRAADCSGTVPIVRVPNDKNMILQVLETGCLGIQVPQINNMAEVQDIVKYVKYYPEGQRGLAFTTRAGNYGIGSFKHHMQRSNDELLISIQIENLKGVRNLNDILKVSGIDVLFIGPLDLSQSLGLPGQTDHPLVKETIEEIFKQGSEAGLAIGIDSNSEEVARNWLDYGMRYVTVGPGVLFKSCKGIAAKIKRIK